MLQILSPDGTIIKPKLFRGLNITFKDCLNIYLLMVRARLFEERMTLESKKAEPKFLYISPRGQEAIQVASAYFLKEKDRIFWYSRSHAAAITKGVSEETLVKSFYGALDEQSIDDFFPHESMPPYVLVGQHLTHATGDAWAQKILGKNGLVRVAYFGEGATSQGDFHSALNWSNIPEHLMPTIFICENNQLAITTPPELQTGTKTFAEKALAYGCAFKVVDGNDPLAVCYATKKALNRARQTERSTLIEGKTYRLGPHTTAVWEIDDRTEELAKAEKLEPLIRMRSFLLGEANTFFQILDEERWTEEKDAAFREETATRLKGLTARIREENVVQLRQNAAMIIQQSVELHKKPFTGTAYQKFPNPSFKPAVFANARCSDVIAIAMLDVMEFDPTVIFLGEDTGKVGSVFRTLALPKRFVEEWRPELLEKLDKQEYLSLQKILGKKRCPDTPLDEEGIAGHAIGLALHGQLRPVAEIQFSGFVFEAMGQIDLMGRLIQFCLGKMPLPIVIRLPFGGGPYIPWHRECEIPYFLPNPGLVIVCPYNAQGFYDMLLAAIASNKPVLFFEDKNLYRSERASNNLVRGLPDRAIEEFGIEIVKEGTDIIITSYGRLVYTALDAAEILKEKHGISAKVLAIQVFSPFDEETLVNEVASCGRLLILQEEPSPVGSEGLLASVIYRNRKSFETLRSPLEIVAPPRAHFPSFQLHEEYLPNADRVVAAALRSINY